MHATRRMLAQARKPDVKSASNTERRKGQLAGSMPVICLDQKRLSHQVTEVEEIVTPDDRHEERWHAVPRDPATQRCMLRPTISVVRSAMSIPLLSLRTKCSWGQQHLPETRRGECAANLRD
jgi:hypothetical protein